jgi:hypothetical protein
MKKINLDTKKLQEKKFELLKDKVSNLTTMDMAAAVGASGYSSYSVCFCVGNGTGYSACWGC